MAAFDLALARVQLDSGDLQPERINALAREVNHTFRNTMGSQRTADCTATR